MENARLVMALAIRFDFTSLFLIPMVPDTARHIIASCFLSDLRPPPHATFLPLQTILYKTARARLLKHKCDYVIPLNFSVSLLNLRDKLTKQKQKLNLYSDIHRLEM